LLIFLFICVFLLSSCGGDSQGVNQNIINTSTPTAQNYTCGVLTVNEICISLDMPDNYSAQRHFIVNVPENIENKAPIFFVLHGSGGRADKTVERFLFRDFIKKNKFIGVFPNAIVRDDGVSTWNAHDETYEIPFIDDVSFFKEIIVKVSAEYNADPENVYIFGWSNGGFMANRLACEIPESITGIFTLAGNLRTELNSCSLASNVAIHHLHATGDITVPFDGDESRGYISAQEAIQRWVEFNYCSLTPVITTAFDLTNDEVGDESFTTIYQECVASVAFTVINGSDHGPEFHNARLHQLMMEFFK